MTRDDDASAHAQTDPGFTVRDLVAVSELQVEIVAGAEGADREIDWVATTEVADPGPWLESGVLLLMMGHGVGAAQSQQRDYVRGLDEHGLAALGFGVGLRWDEVPEALLDEAERRAFPVVRVPYEVPFLAINKVVFERVANRQLLTIHRAQEVSDELVSTVLGGERHLPTLVRMLAAELRASVALRDADGEIVAEAHSRGTRSFDEAREIPVAAGPTGATLLAVSDSGEFDEYGQLVLHHGVTAIAFELSRSHSVSVAELRLAGNLLSDLERGVADKEDVTRRLSAFGLDPARPYAALAIRAPGIPGTRTQTATQAELTRRAVANIATVEGERTTFLVAVASAGDAVELARGIVRNHDAFRIGVGRPGVGVEIGQSVREASAALTAGGEDSHVVSYEDLGSLGLLMSLPDDALEAYARATLGTVLDDQKLVTTLATLLEHGGRVLEASKALGIHRHTMRNRMEKIAELTGRRPDEPTDRIDLWIAVRARAALALRREREAALSGQADDR